MGTGEGNEPAPKGDVSSVPSANGGPSKERQDPGTHGGCAVNGERRPPDHIMRHGLSWRRVDYDIPCGADTVRGVRCRRRSKWICSCGVARCDYHADAKRLRDDLKRQLARLGLSWMVER